MSEIKIKVSSVNFIPVNSVFLDKYLPIARGDFIKVYLYCLKCGYENCNVTFENISSALNLLQTDVMNALEYWENEGVIRIHPEGTIEFLPIKSEIEPHPSLEFDKKVKGMFTDIEKLIGRPLSSIEYSSYLDFISSFNFTPEIITLLVEFCAQKGKTDIRYIEKVALSWYDSGIKTYEDAQNYITQREEKWKKYREIISYIKVKDTDISKPQEEFLEKWLYKYNFPVDVVKEACRICIMRIEEPKFNYIDAILNDWYKNGVKTISDIKKNEKKGKPKKRNYAPIPGASSNQRKYDGDELEKLLLGRSGKNEK
ncbi:MAG TPA: DNA replication protein DnaD [Clostridiaceae bacterium]|jgi:DnaD/phage-associated family protein|nr:DNA replication protein DnaD [Clostridiaceae bacterium]HBF77687.1 DNA replication protein DnaD [Clostridiaceae bacterium]HBG39606.1 DNA replication protein DnaD [Clostridiaceae bacterium]HBN28899.1 DNA replication protein DnaD [Clostridiaceae bacterium]HCL49561.1 DNA replication protein DnaD [Clostridiaceae bacterium]